LGELTYYQVLVKLVLEEKKINYCLAVI
jgi:hypothetical protein